MTQLAAIVAALSTRRHPVRGAIFGRYLVLSDGHRLVAAECDDPAMLPGDVGLLSTTENDHVPGLLILPTPHVEDVAALLAWCGGPWTDECPDCDGRGKEQCGACYGSGKCDGACSCCGAKSEHECERCDGTGEAACRACGGSGVVVPVREGKLHGLGLDRSLLDPLLRLVDAPTVELGVDADHRLALAWPGHRAVLMGLRSVKADAPVWPVK